MDKKTTSWVAYCTFIGWIVAYCAGDKEGAKFHLNQGLVIALGNIAVQLYAKGDIDEITPVIMKSTEIKTYEPTDEAAWDKAYEKFLKLI